MGIIDAVGDVPRMAKIENLQDGEMIQIKKKNRGLLHENLGVPKGEKIPGAKLEAAKVNAGPALKKRIVFAENAKKWNHK